MAHHLGTIRQLSGASTSARHLFVYDTALVVARESGGATFRKEMFGNLEVSKKRAKKRQKAQAAELSDPEALAASHDKNELIPVDSIEKAELKKTKARLYRELQLTLTDGSTKSYGWQPGHNKDKATVPLLRSALGPRLRSF